MAALTSRAEAATMAQLAGQGITRIMVREGAEEEG
jgi:hypothetical protein